MSSGLDRFSLVKKEEESRSSPHLEENADIFLGASICDRISGIVHSSDCHQDLRTRSPVANPRFVLVHVNSEPKGIYSSTSFIQKLKQSFASALAFFFVLFCIFKDFTPRLWFFETSINKENTARYRNNFIIQGACIR